MPLRQFVGILKPYVVSREQYTANCSNSAAISQLLKKLSKYTHAPFYYILFAACVSLGLLMWAHSIYRLDVWVTELSWIV